MLDQLLNYFPDKAYLLTIVHDPDRLLEVEDVQEVLVKRGFRLVYEPDAIYLRHQVEKLEPFSVEEPVIIRTQKALNDLPYDLWQRGHRVQLSLYTFFPMLSYPIIQQLTPSQIWQLSYIDKPHNRLGYEGTIRYILKMVFGIDINKLRQADYVLIWLNEYHNQVEPMADVFLDFLVKLFDAMPEYDSWPIPEIITNKDIFLDLMQSLWEKFIDRKTNSEISEQKIPYEVNFDKSDLIQSNLSKMIQFGHIQPVKIAKDKELPYWIKPGVIEKEGIIDIKRIKALQKSFGEYTLKKLGNYRWEDWQRLAHEWAELTVLRNKSSTTLSTEQENFFKNKQDVVNTAFLTWLKAKYSYLAGLQLPSPHHLYHVLHYLAHERNKGTIDKIALLVMDGMALADWKILHDAWRSRHDDWKFDEKLLLAQMPTITSISRQALISGLRPIEFAESLKDNRQEPNLWSAFWRENQIAESDIVYDRLSKATEKDFPVWVDKPRMKVVCMVKNDLDDIIHNAMGGSKGFFSDLNIWLDTGSQYLEKLLEALLDKRFSIYVTSDHGHVEAVGFGKITDEGLTVETRAKRARVYSNLGFASKNQEKCSPSFIWHGDNLLPEETWALIPEKNNAYVSEGEIVVAHGGASLEEVVVPFVRIEK